MADHEQGRMALLLIDVINDMDFDGGEKLLPAASAAAGRIEALRRWTRRRGGAVIYVNDNFGRWTSDFRSQVERCTMKGVPGREIAECLRPAEGDHFVLKPKHSGFYATPLELLLRHLGVRRLVLTGFAADICVLYTAHDAHMRGYEVIVPSDAVAAESEEAKAWALRHIEERLGGRVCLTEELIADSGMTCGSGG